MTDTGTVISSVDQSSFCDKVTITLSGHSSYSEYERQLELYKLSEDWTDADVVSIKENSDGYMINVSIELVVAGVDNADTVVDDSADPLVPKLDFNGMCFGENPSDVGGYCFWYKLGTQTVEMSTTTTDNGVEGAAVIETTVYSIAESLGLAGTMGVVWVPYAKWNDDLYAFNEEILADDPFLNLSVAEHGLIMNPTLADTAVACDVTPIATADSFTAAADSDDGIDHTYSYVVTQCTTANYYDGGSAEAAIITARWFQPYHLDSDYPNLVRLSALETATAYGIYPDINSPLLTGCGSGAALNNAIQLAVGSLAALTLALIN